MLMPLSGTTTVGLPHNGPMPDEPMDRLSKGLIAGAGAFVLMCMVAYAGDANGPLFTVWIAGLGVGVA